MGTTPKSFEEYLVFGEEGEHLVASYLMSKGVTVAPLYQYQRHNTAPFLLSIDSGISKKHILPDLSCYKDGKAFFVEVKRKNQWWVNHLGGFNETGVDARLWEHYKDIALDTKCDVFLFFLHETAEPLGLYYGEIKRLAAFCPRLWRSKSNNLVFVREEWLTKVNDSEWKQEYV